MIGQPSSPGMCVSSLRLGAVNGSAGATFCIDMTIAPVDRPNRRANTDDYDPRQLTGVSIAQAGMSFL